MQSKVQKRFWAGFQGALILIVIMYVFEIINIAGNPGFVHTYRSFFGPHYAFIDHLVAAFLFAVSGGIWGIIFGIVPSPSPLRGMAFGLLPSLWLWLVVVPSTGGPVFNGFAAKGIILPLIFNCVIWGSYVGWYGQKFLERHPVHSK